LTRASGVLLAIARISGSFRLVERLFAQIQRVVQERALFAPVWENGFIRAYGPRMEEAALSLIPAFPYAGPLEELRVKGK